MQRPRGRAALAVLFAVLAAAAWIQVFSNLRSRSDPPSLAVLHSLIAASATATAAGSWSMARWAPIAALVYGVASAGLLVALTPVLGLEPSAAWGLWLGAAIIALFALLVARYLRRSSRRADAG